MESFYVRYHIYLLTVFCLSSAFNLAAQEAAEQEAAMDTPVPPIYLASKQGRLNKVRELIAGGTDVNIANGSGRTALMAAVFYGNRAIVRELLSEGANVDAVDAQGRTALMTAVANKKLDIVELLLAAGADVTIEDAKKQTAITLADKSNLSKSQKKGLVKLLEKAAE